MIWPSTPVDSCIVIINKCTSIASEALSPRTSPRYLICYSTRTAHNLPKQYAKLTSKNVLFIMRNNTDLNSVNLLSGCACVRILITCIAIVEIPVPNKSSSKPAQQLHYLLAEKTDLDRQKKPVMNILLA